MTSEPATESLKPLRLVTVGVAMLMATATHLARGEGATKAVYNYKSVLINVGILVMRLACCGATAPLQI
jgi:hypothetical protein